MNSNTAYNHLKRLEKLVCAIHADGRRYGQTHKTILAELKAKVWDDPALAKCPAWVKASLSHQSQFLYDEVYRPKLYAKELEKMLADAKAGREVKPVAYVYWQHRLDGKFISSEEIAARSKAGDIDIWKRIESNHIWNHTRTDFGEWSVADARTPQRNPHIDPC